MSDSMKERLATDFQKAKVESGTRLVRVGKAFSDAASQAISEFKEGSGEVRTIAKDSLSTIAENLNEKNTEPTSETNSTTIRTLAATIFKSLSAQLRGQMLNLDVKLTERYSDRYTTTKQTAKQTAKQRFERFTVWYNNAKVNAEATGAAPLQQRQVELENKVGQAGASVARKEHQIRQQLKDLLQTAAAKL